MSDALQFFCPGKPQTAGSKSPVPTKAGLRVLEAGSKESRARKRTWRGDLRDAALRAGAEDWLAAGACGPLRLTVVIVRRRPGSHLGTGRNAGVVKDWARELLPVGRPDSTKILRAAEDALTGVLWQDDSCVVHHETWKAFADQVGQPVGQEGMYVAVERCGGYTGPLWQGRLAA